METRSRSRAFAMSEPDLSPNSVRFRNRDPPPLGGRPSVVIHSATSSLESINSSSRNPTPTGEGSLAWDPSNLSLAGDRPPRGLDRGPDDCEERIGALLANDGGGTPVSEARLLAELASLRKHIDVAVTQSRDETVARIPAFIDVAENRVRQSVTDAIGADYNRVAIKCVENRVSCRNEFAKLQKSDGQVLLETTNKVDGLVSQVESLVHEQERIAQRLGELAPT